MGADSFPYEVEALLALADECGLTLDQAQSRIRRITDGLADWKAVARANGIALPESCHFFGFWVFGWVFWRVCAGGVWEKGY